MALRARPRRGLLHTTLGVAWVAACSRAATPLPRDDRSVSVRAPHTAPTRTMETPSPASRATRPPWPRTLPPAAAVGDGEGRWLRAIIHAHSVQSSDACDTRPYVDGAPNEPCLQSFRRGLCATKVDVVFLTEHANRLASVRFEESMQLRGDDEPLRENGALVGYRIACSDGHRVMVLPGAENDLMPLALARHPAPVAGSLDRAYRSSGSRGARLFREAGAIVALAHPETRSRAQVRAVAPEVIELYNIHANVDPAIAGPALGIDVPALHADILEFAAPGSELDPDWGFLAIFRENNRDLEHWAALAAEGRRVTAIAGSDAHENRFPMVFSDGERGDSYRRFFRWYTNVLRIEGEPTRRAVLDALVRGRAWAVLDAWGTPEGFSFNAVPERGARALDGDVVTKTPGLTLRVTAPRVHGLDVSLPAPAVRVRLLRAEREGRWREVAAGTDTITYTPSETGAYRAEAMITPHHARPYLPGMERLIREVPWVYSNAIRVE